MLYICIYIYSTPSHPATQHRILKIWLKSWPSAQSKFWAPQMICGIRQQSVSTCTLLKTNIFAPENGWLEDDRFLLGPGIFSGAFAVSFRVVFSVGYWSELYLSISKLFSFTLCLMTALTLFLDLCNPNICSPSLKPTYLLPLKMVLSNRHLHFQGV